MSMFPGNRKGGRGNRYNSSGQPSQNYVSSGPGRGYGQSVPTQGSHHAGGRPTQGFPGGRPTQGFPGGRPTQGFPGGRPTQGYPGGGQSSSSSYSSPPSQPYQTSPPPPASQYAAEAPAPPPPISDLSAWFDHFDRDRGGSLSQEEVVSGLVTTLRNQGQSPDVSEIRNSVYNVWVAFDQDGSGTIDKREFVAPGGLGESLQAMSAQMDGSGDSSSGSGPPGKSSSSYGGGSGTYGAPTAPSSSGGYGGSGTYGAPTAPSSGGGGYGGSSTYGAPSAPPSGGGYGGSGTYGAPTAYAPSAPKTKLMRVGIPPGMGPGQMVQIPNPNGGESLKITIPDSNQWTRLPSGQSAFDHRFEVPEVPEVVAQPAPQAPPPPETKLMRVGIPPGIGPGQTVKIPHPNGGESLLVTIPDSSEWIRLPSGQAAFDHRFVLNPPPAAAAASVVGNDYAPYSTKAGDDYNSHGAYVPQQPQAYQRPPEPFVPYEHAPYHSYAPPPLGMRAVALSHQPVPLSGRRRALLVGINYPGTSAELRGCVNDARMMRDLLRRNGYPDDSSHMVMLTDERSTPGNYRPTGENILKAAQWLVQGVAAGDTLFFHFSGHGSQQEDKSGMEADGLNETICPSDYKRRQITDDELWGTMVHPLPNGVRLTAVMDCCHSGTGLDLPYEYDMKKNKYKNKYNKDQKTRVGDWELEVNPAHSEGDVVLFSGCEDDQTSADVQGGGGGFLNQYQAGGAMTLSFVRAYEETPMVTFEDLMHGIHRSLKQRGFSQRPSLTSSQPFEAGSRIVSFHEGHVENNHNAQIGRTKNKHYKPKRKFGSQMDNILGFSAGDALAVGLGALVLGSIFD